MRSALFLAGLLLALCALVARAKDATGATASAVLDLGEAHFDSTLAANKGLLVEFFAPCA